MLASIWLDVWTTPKLQMTALQELVMALEILGMLGIAGAIAVLFVIVVNR